MLKIPIEILIIGICAISLVIVILSMYLVLKGARNHIVSRKKKKYIQNKQDIWYRYFNDDIPLPSELIPNNNSEIKAVEEIFLAYVENISSPIIKKKIREFSNQYLRRYYLNLLLHRRWSLRMNALYRIVSFEIDSLVDECKKYAKRAKLSSEERFQLLIIHSMFDEDSFINEFVDLLLMLSEYEYKKLLVSFNAEILEKLTLQIDEFPEEYQYYFIDVLGIKRNFSFLTFLENNLSHDNTEIRIRSLKAINEMGMITDLDRYKVFLDSPVWEERLMLAKLLGAFPLEQVYPYLEELLQDENWWVRSQSARTIGNSKNGKSRLEMFIATAQDQYAIEMAQEVLVRGY
ncbi:MAG TPA: HEAT repeat domain-containing protein [Bacillota bacterium]|jgi:hypothetical protein|nr:HEAT repeat domain-containing protein [Bacillota bacterium]